MATTSIPEPFAARPPKPSSLAHGKGAIACLARLAARTAVKEQLRSQGLHPTRMKASDIERQARQYLEDHRELYFDALERASKLGLIGQEDRDTLLALLDLARYLCSPTADSGTESTQIWH